MLDQNDYIMKQINQLAQVLIKIIQAVVGLRGKGSAQEAMEMTQEVFTEYLDLDIDELLKMDTKDMIHKLEEMKSMTHENLESVADLFYALAETMNEDEGNDHRSDLLLNKALSIYKYIEEEGNVYSIDRNHRIEEIKKIL